MKQMTVFCYQFGKTDEVVRKNKTGWCSLLSGDKVQ